MRLYGRSMLPWVWPGVDVDPMPLGPEAIYPGSLLIYSRDGALVMHRVHAVRGDLVGLRGDHQRGELEWVDRAKLLAEARGFVFGRRSIGAPQVLVRRARRVAFPFVVGSGRAFAVLRQQGRSHATRAGLLPLAAVHPGPVSRGARALRALGVTRLAERRPVVVRALTTSDEAAIRAYAKRRHQRPDEVSSRIREAEVARGGFDGAQLVAIALCTGGRCTEMHALRPYRLSHALRDALADEACVGHGPGSSAPAPKLG